MNNIEKTRYHVMQQTALRSGKTFLLPHIRTIEDFVDLSWLKYDEGVPESHEPYRGARIVDRARDFYFLTGEFIGGRWRPLFVRAKREYGMAIQGRCTDRRTGGYRVIKGSWPDPFALLLANDSHHIANIFLALIDWEGYKVWRAEQFDRVTNKGGAA